MSNSATTAAKRRRAGAIMSPMMQNTAPTVPPMSNAGPIARPRNTPALQKDIAINNINANRQPQPNQMQAQQQQQPAPVAKPLTLTQVIGHIDTRLLTLEKKVTTVTETIAKYPDPDLIMETSDEPLETTISEEVLANFIKVDEVDAIVQENITPHVQEFDHRYQVLVSEIAELKQALMKLQTYTLEINKTLFEERIQILSEMGPNVDKTVNDTTNVSHEQSNETDITAEASSNELPDTAHEDIIETVVEEEEQEPEFDINQLISQSM